MTAGAKKPFHLVSVFPGFGVGGAQVRFAALANRMGDACRHSIVALNGDLACREKLAAGVAVTFPDSGHRHGAMPAAVLHARRFLGACDADLVVTSNWGAIEWAIGARLAGLRHIHTEDGFGPEERDSQIRRRVLTRRVALRGSELVLPSRRLEKIAREVWRLPPRKLHYIPNGIDLARFCRAAPVVLPPGEGPVIGTVAALRAEKNIARLLRAFLQLREGRPARLVIVGDGPERAPLKQIAAASLYPQDVIFAGHTTQAEGWLAAMDVFALSSDTEQMPLSLLEAMASGLPAVSTDVGDVRMMLAAPNLPYVTAPDDADFGAALAALLDAKCPKIGAANRAKAEHAYGQEAMFSRYATLFGVTLPEAG